MTVTTISESLGHARVAWSDLDRRYHPVLALVKVLIGVVPNCDRYLEIWEPGFRTYNLMVPNFLNLPAALFGVGVPKDMQGLAMYESSRAASCAYCSAHTCSYALRRGASPQAVTGKARTPREASVVAVAHALSTLPHHFTPELGRALHVHFTPAQAEWIVMSVAMMGFLNKFMDAMGVELEPESVRDVAALIEPTGWSIGQHAWAGDERSSQGSGGAATAAHTMSGPPKDSIATLLGALRHAPGALALEREWMQGVPKDAAAARAFVADRFGFEEPLLETLRHARPRRALAAMLRHNLDPALSKLGIGPKALAGLVFARHAGNAPSGRTRQAAGGSSRRAASGGRCGRSLLRHTCGT